MQAQTKTRSAAKLLVLLTVACGSGRGPEGLTQPETPDAPSPKPEGSAGSSNPGSVAIPAAFPANPGAGPGEVVQGSLWSDPATWGGRLPDPNADLTIPEGTKVVLDQNACVAGLTLEGELGFANADLEFCANWIMIHGKGRLSIGSEAQPFADRATITLKDGGDPNQDVMGMGTKFIGAMHGGRLDLHGRDGVSAWTQLTAAVAQGATLIEVVDAAGWQAGDSIVLASDSLEPDEAEVHELVLVNGNQLTLKQGLRFARTGQVQSIESRNVDTRAEVGRLTRNIVIQGDAASDATEFGGHVMIMAGGEAYIEGIELRRMGQFDHLGRYPFHWHVVGEASGQYLRNSVVNTSYQRGIVVHSTLHTLVEDNLVFDSRGHNYIVETPQTNDNVFRHNLAVNNRIAVFSEPTLKTQNDNEASNFWIKSARNSFVGNAAAGSSGSGFWYDGTSDGPTFFDKNVAHSAAGRGTGADFVRESGLLVQPMEPESGVGPVLSLGNSTLYQNVINLWPSEVAQSYHDMILVGAAGPSVTAEAVDAEVTLTGTLFVGPAPGKRSDHVGPALLVQYGARVRLEVPVFVGFSGGVFSDNDIAKPSMSDLVLSGARFVDSSKGTLPENSIAELKDDAFLPAGFYVPASAPDMAGPNMTLVSLPDAEGEPYQVYFGQKRECPLAEPLCAWGQP